MLKAKKNTTCGFTLVECVTVIAILACIATLGVVKMARSVEKAKRTAAESDLRMLREAWLDPATGYVRDLRGIPGFSLAHLRMGNLFTPTNLYGAVEIDGATTAGRRVDIADPGSLGAQPCARPEVFTRWNPESERGWHGPYLAHASGAFPTRTYRRFGDDASANARGFFPNLSGLRLPDDFLEQRDDCSIYGFPGEPALIDPWDNPYVLQIPPPQAFQNAVTNVADDVRFRYARLVSAGPNGRLDTPCFDTNLTNVWATTWTERECRLSRQAGRIDGNDLTARGDDLVLFLVREDVDEGEGQPEN